MKVPRGVVAKPPRLATFINKGHADKIPLMASLQRLRRGPGVLVTVVPQMLDHEGKIFPVAHSCLEVPEPKARWAPGL
jgi:hypothetical protein